MERVRYKNFTVPFRLHTNPENFESTHDLQQCLDFLKCDLDTFVQTAIHQFIARVIGEKEGEKYWVFVPSQGDMQRTYIGRLSDPPPKRRKKKK